MHGRGHGDDLESIFIVSILKSIRKGFCEKRGEKVGEKLKIVRQDGFTVLPNQLIRDPTLSLESLGLLARMLMLPDDWDFSVAGLAKLSGCGKDKIRTALGNIEKSGYLLREQEHGAHGKFVNTYVLYDVPNAHRVGLTDAAEPCREIRRKQNKDIQIPPIVPQGGQRAHRRTKVAREAPDWKPERFAKLWEFYPHNKRGNKQKAMDMWDRLHPSDELIAEIGRSLKRLLASDAWQDGVAIPHVSTFLNPLTERWKDADNLDGGGARSGHMVDGSVFGWQ